MEKRLIVVLCCLFIAVGISTAEESSSPSLHDLQTKITEYKRTFTPYGDIRLRHTYGDEWFLNDKVQEGNWNFARYRVRVGEKIELDENMMFDVRLTWEFRSWDDPTGPGKASHMDGDEAIFDIMNLTVKNLFDAPITGKFGRQDMFMNKWLIIDGTPFDGSRTCYFDAAKLTFDFDDSATKVDLVYIDQAAATEDRLRPIGNENGYVTEQDETAVILYLTNKSIADTTLEGYFIYKNDNPIDDSPADTLSKALPPTWSKKAEIFTFGGAVSGHIDANWSYRVEGAIQTGDKDENNDGNTSSMRAYGSNNSLAYNFNDDKKSQLRLEYEFLSGDNDKTDGEVHGFDPLWGEYPRFSELYAYTYAFESSIGELTNLHRVGCFYDLSPMENVKLQNGYNLMWADETNSVAGRTDGGGNFRGQLFTARLMYQMTKNLSARVDAEYFIPGDFYNDNRQEEATFLRGQIMYSF
ncbi:MAG: alginate export family protein [Sedimentisphaeraceae bacterium JB056]